MIGPTAALLRSSLWALRRSIIWWSIGLAGLIGATVAFWPAFRGASGISEAIDSLPGPIIDAFGLQDFGTPAGFLRGNLYELFVPLLLSIAAIALVNGQTASDESAGRLELFLAQPVSRPSVFAARFAGCQFALGVIGIVVFALQLGSDQIFDLSIDTRLIVATVVLCCLLAMLHGSIAYVLAALWPRPSVVLGLSIAIVLAGYVIAALFPISDALKPYRVISPWEWALGGNPLEAATDWWRYLALAGPTLVLAAAGSILVRRRDVAAA